MKKSFTLVSLLTLFLYVNTFVEASVFFRNIKQGDMGEDVRALQVVLNKDPDTVVANDGPGSKGNETEYFGAKTTDAVKRFQNKYKNEVLYPAGLLIGNGFVGVNTRKKVDTVSDVSKITPIGNESVSTISKSSVPSLGVSKSITPTFVVSPVFDQNVSKPKLYFVSPYQAKQGTKIVLHGQSFSSVFNTVFIGSSVSITNIKSSDGSTVEVTLPDTTVLPSGFYQVWVTNSIGSSQDLRIPIVILVTQTPKLPPRVISVSPPSTTPSGTITITGENFSSNGNNIFSGAGEIDNVPSVDGKTITIALSSFPFMSKIINAPKVTSFSLSFVVQNENGIDRVSNSVQVIIPKQ
jgi:hypothetical protein